MCARSSTASHRTTASSGSRASASRYCARTPGSPSRTWSRPAAARSGHAASSSPPAAGRRCRRCPGWPALTCLTNETVFDLAELPRRLLVLGAGPIGCELAQAFRRLGAEVDHRRSRPDPAARRPGADRGGARAAARRGRATCTSTPACVRGGARPGSRAGAVAAAAVCRARICWSPPAARPMVEESGPRRGRRRVRRTRASRSTRGCAPRNARVFALGDVLGGLAVHPRGRLPGRAS